MGVSTPQDTKRFWNDGRRGRLTDKDPKRVVDAKREISLLRRSRKIKVTCALTGRTVQGQRHSRARRYRIAWADR